MHFLQNCTFNKGGAENAGLELNRSKSQGWKMHDWN